MKHLVVFLVISCFVLVANAQKVPEKRKTAAKPKNTVTINGGLAAIFSAKNGKILIRWAPKDENTWSICNKYGYILEKRVILRDGKIVNGAKGYESYILKADSLNYWIPIIDSNDNAAVMAQALYGQEFYTEVSGNTTLGGSSLFQKAEENKQRFVFGMFAADNDFLVAEKAGLAFTDTAVKPNEKYFYRIFPAAPKNVLRSDTALLMVGLSDSMPLPQVPEVLVEPYSKLINLSWDIDRTKTYYNAFLLERSQDDDTAFKSISDKPFTSFGQQKNPRLSNSIMFTDTSIEENHSYRYRVRGLTIFGEKGPWSSIVQGKSLSLLEGVPGIQGVVVGEGNKMLLTWYYEDSLRKKITGFELNHSKQEAGPYRPVGDLINASASEILLPDTLEAGYLIVKAIGKVGISRTSFPYLYQPEDSIPPQVPRGITAVSDSNGIVTVKWLPSPDKDLLGYKVFRAQVSGEEPAVLVDTVWLNNVYTDTLDIRMLNRKAWYYVAALDYRHNQSALSKATEVTKPDIIPPSPPVFANYEILQDKVVLNWVNTKDEDLAYTIIQKRESESSNWKDLFKTTSATTSMYVDKVIAPEKKYSYRLFAFDSSGNRSPEAQVLTLQTLPAVVDRSVIKQVQLSVDRDKRMIYMRWELQAGSKIKSFEVFRGQDKEQMTLYKVLDGKFSDLLDNELTINTVYRYGIRALLTDGSYSQLVTKEINY